MKLHNLFTIIGIIFFAVALASSINLWHWLLSFGTLMAGLICFLVSEIILLRAGHHYLQSRQAQKLALKRGGAWFGE